MSYDFRGKRIYLSGPMTGYEDWNRHAFAEAEEWCYGQGAAEVFNPAKSAPLGADYHSPAHWMLKTLHELTRYTDPPEWEWHSTDRSPYWDAFILLPGWERSKGACAEFECASACGIRILHYDDERGFE